MKKVLVVEDEKFIRQGIAAMIKRSGVPVEEVIECNNGIAALEVLSNENIDVMFTDIRMPKMNGIELVQEVEQLGNPPLIVAVSGYDDFSYAVEMMRHGVKEYILKPVERDKLKAVIEKLEEELNLKLQDKEKIKAVDNQLLKYMLSDKDSKDEDTSLMAQKLLDEVGGEYVVVVATTGSCIKPGVGIALNDVDGSNVFIIAESDIPEVENTRYIGVSEVYSSVTDLKRAFTEAMQRRGEAFIQNMSKVDYDLPQVPKELKKIAIKLTEKAQVSARVQLMGTDRAKDLKKDWDSFFIAAARGQISPEDFYRTIDCFVSEFTAVYKANVPEEIIKPLKTDCLDSYRENFMNFVLAEQQRLNETIDSNQTLAKIQEAIAYIEENYSKDINMAVVSNRISMNYTLFSAEFKNITGKNFVTYVKDLRMSEAKSLLAETDMKVNEISAKVGYDNEKHFMKSFKAYVGVSPSEYRKNLRIV